MEIIKKDYHIVGTPQFSEVSMVGYNENCISVEVFYRKNLEPKGYYIEAQLCSRGENEYGTFYTLCFNYSKTRCKRLLAKETSRRGKKAEADAIVVFNEKSKWVAEQFGLKIEEI